VFEPRSRLCVVEAELRVTAERRDDASTGVRYAILASAVSLGMVVTEVPAGGAPAMLPARGGQDLEKRE
jgi:hypothetical protein